MFCIYAISGIKSDTLSIAGVCDVAHNSWFKDLFTESLWLFGERFEESSFYLYAVGNQFLGSIF